MPIQPLPADALRWTCDEEALPFQTTEEVEAIAGVVGQASAVDSLLFGLEVDAPGQNIFIRGLAGTGRMTLVRRLLEQLRPACRVKLDRCYVHNFSQPDRPRLLSLEAGKARAFRRSVHELAEYIRDELTGALKDEALKARREALEKREREEVEAITQPFEKDLKEADLALVSMQLGPIAQTAIFPVVDGKPVPPEDYEQMRAQGEITELQFSFYQERKEGFLKRLREVSEQIRTIRRKYATAVHSIIEETARTVLGDIARGILADFPGDDVQHFLSEVIDDVAENRLTGANEDDPLARYGVNIVREHESADGCPIVIENTPTMMNLLGSIDREWRPQGAAHSDYRMIHAGSILRADGGYLVLDAREVISEPGAWKVLMRTLRTGRLEVVPPELMWPGLAPALKPEPIPINLKVILLGDRNLYYLLDRYDPDFVDLFKVLADFDTEIDREPEGVRQYAGVIARIARDEKLLPFDRSGVAALAEHGARIAAQQSKLTARFARVADIAREAAFIARRDEAATVFRRHVETAVHRTKRRADLPSRRFREYLANGTIKVQTQGKVVGQINGLAVISAGPLTYGFPARITATIGAGSAGIIDIEAAAQLSGAIHTKGFNILGGLLRHLLQTDHPLAFSASLAFEQSYGGIDGDSASGAEMCCLLSALTHIPLRQDTAMTGAIDQMGHVQAIGGVNEKIEGFFDICQDFGLTGTQGVIIPQSNAGDLMLRPDVVAACSEEQFYVYAVETVHEALEILTGMKAGQRDEEGHYPENTLLYEAVEQAREYWLKSIARPVFHEHDEEEGDEAEGEKPPEGGEGAGATPL